MKVVVTGGSGLLGKNLRDIVNKKYNEHEFIYLNYSQNNEFSVDLTNRDAVLEFFKNNKFDYIIHLAANVGGLFKNLNNNARIFTDNIRINENILEACHINNIQRGIFILSSCIYPFNPSKFPMTENMLLETPPHYSNNGYAYAKRMLYIQCNNYNKDYGRNYICLSPVNLYGKYDNFNLEDGHFVPSIIHRFHNQKLQDTLVAYGTGSPLRQLLYALDMADIICKVLFDKINVDLLNICGDDENTIKYYIEKICNVVGVDNTKIIWDTTKSDGCMKKTISNKKFKLIYPDYKFTPLEDGLKETYDWFVQNYENCRK